MSNRFDGMWGREIKAQAEAKKQAMTNNKPTEAPKPTWRSDKARAAICEAAELIANHYCSEDDTYSLEVERLTAAIAKVVDSVDPPAAPDEAAAPSDAWRQWFAQVGEAATVNVVNATATLVIAERAIVSPADEADKALAYQLISEYGGTDDRGLLRSKFAAALAQARKETWEKAIRVAQLSAQKSEKASLDIAAAEILIRRLELAARDGREGKQERVNQDE